MGGVNAREPVDLIVLDIDCCDDKRRVMICASASDCGADPAPPLMVKATPPSQQASPELPSTTRPPTTSSTPQLIHHLRGRAPPPVQFWIISSPTFPFPNLLIPISTFPPPPPPSCRAPAPRCRSSHRRLPQLPPTMISPTTTKPNTTPSPPTAPVAASSSFTRNPR